MRVETLKSMAVEPQMQRRWEEELAGYVAASFRVLSLGNRQARVSIRQQADHGGDLCFGARLVIGGDLTVGELVAFNMPASRVSAPVLRLAQMWQDFHQARLRRRSAGQDHRERPPATHPYPGKGLNES
jgi:subfamily B ATP-binding cassette protein HlyB/CyaB